ncbi:hypothetical protein U9M48_012199 [Paspalum notatum var. saurae]|uniref:Uncharacterized protein n=1 Tax=Paspalum notatum var. saurae TaxID=547442 RepID=A0AAQ3SWZ7_PASNO
MSAPPAPAPAAAAHSLAMPSSVTARSDTALKTFPAAAPGLSTASASMPDRSRACAMLVSCIPFPGIGTGRFRTIPKKRGVHGHGSRRRRIGWRRARWQMACRRRCRLLCSYCRRTTPRSPCCCRSRSCTAAGTPPSCRTAAPPGWKHL